MYESTYPPAERVVAVPDCRGPCRRTLTVCCVCVLLCCVCVLLCCVCVLLCCVCVLLCCVCVLLCSVCLRRRRRRELRAERRGGGGGGGGSKIHAQKIAVGCEARLGIVMWHRGVAGHYTGQYHITQGGGGGSGELHT
jgi:hypothetical protein